MSFVALQENVRKELRKRVEAGELTGMELARRTGFTQAHISNFLNRKRGLKLSALDRMLKAVGLSLYDLLNPHELSRFAAVPAGGDADYVEIPLVAPEVAAAAEVIVNQDVEERVRFRRSLLNQLHPDFEPASRKSWTRFILLAIEGREAMSMWPRLGTAAILLIDRHYNSLHLYRKNERNLYAVRLGDGCTVKYVETAGSLLVLRPHSPDFPVETVPLPESGAVSGLIVGRVAQICAEV